MQQPKVIFLDAVGTLFGVRGSVGEIYATIAQQVGIDVSPDILNKTFFESFKVAKPFAFPRVDETEVPQLEYQWWYSLAYRAFAQAGVIEQFTDFNRFFEQLYHYFATKESWFVYADVVKMLIRWQQQGIELGIISNFDTRIYQVLEQLELKDFFSSITISSLAGNAKPDRHIFLMALEKHGSLPQQAWHIGDSLTDDYYGAKAVGIKPFLIKRP